MNSLKTSWLSLLKIYGQPVCIRMFFLGFSAGLPLLLVVGTLGFWLREADIDLKIIGFMSWVGLIYGCKWLWAPLVDNLELPYLTRILGQRRAWLLASQLLIMASLCGMAFSDPKIHFKLLILFTLMAAFGSATQDISLDAYRIESADVKVQGALAATYQTGYRVAMIWAGAGALALAAFFQITDSKTYDPIGWKISYLIMAASMSVGLITTLCSPKPNKKDEDNKLKQISEMSEHITDFVKLHPNLPSPLTRFVGWLKFVAWLPISDFFVRYQWHAVAILLLIATYRISDVVMGVMSNPFYRDMGFTKDEVAAISKVFGVIMTLLGTFLGGIVVLRAGVLKTLFLGALLSAATNILFSFLAVIGHSVTFLIFTVSADNLAGGIASAAFIAYLSGLTNVAYSATQYAVFSSIMFLLPKFIAGFSGVMVQSIGYSNFFLTTAAIGVPVLFLILLVGKLENPKSFN